MIAKGLQKDKDRAASDLQVKDPLRRGDAAANLGVFGDASLIPTLAKLLGDSSEYVRVSALYALTLLGDKDAVGKLVPYVGHARDHFRKLALTALETACGQKLGGPHDNADMCKDAQASWEKWWTGHAAKATWDAQKKVWKA
ncbi:MAG: HEAT repeat domain-containing protein [Planctomycetes bacterium]|nr:HEAT repeat domain-containing protein [Planctomycetota bacterium]